MDRVTERTQFFHPIWNTVAEYIKQDKIRLYHLHRRVFENRPEARSLLERELVEAAATSLTLTDQREVRSLLGILAAQNGEFQKSLEHCKAALDPETGEGNALRYLIWICLQLGLRTDAQVAAQAWSRFQKRSRGSGQFSKGIDVSRRWAHLIFLLEAIQHPQGSVLEELQGQRATQEKAPCDFDFECLVALGQAVLGRTSEAYTTLKRVTRTFPREWFGSLLLAVGGVCLQDVALCFDLLQACMQQAPKAHHAFIDSLRVGMLQCSTQVS
jgi:tetratricopeptide (TPR) repeat protein